MKLYPNIFDFIKFASFSCIFRGRTLQFWWAYAIHASSIHVCCLERTTKNREI